MKKKMFNKALLERIFLWGLLILVIYAIFTMIIGKTSSRCGFNKEIGDYACNDPVYGQ